MSVMGNGMLTCVNLMAIINVKLLSKKLPNGAAFSSDIKIKQGLFK